MTLAAMFFAAAIGWTLLCAGLAAVLIRSCRAEARRETAHRVQREADLLAAAGIVDPLHELAVQLLRAEYRAAGIEATP